MNRRCGLYVQSVMVECGLSADALMENCVLGLTHRLQLRHCDHAEWWGLSWIYISHYWLLPGILARSSEINLAIRKSRLELNCSKRICPIPILFFITFEKWPLSDTKYWNSYWHYFHLHLLFILYMYYINKAYSRFWG